MSNFKIGQIVSIESMNEFDSDIASTIAAEDCDMFGMSKEQAAETEIVYPGCQDMILRVSDEELSIASEIEVFADDCTLIPASKIAIKIYSNKTNGRVLSFCAAAFGMNGEVIFYTRNIAKQPIKRIINAMLADKSWKFTSHENKNDMFGNKACESGTMFFTA